MHSLHDHSRADWYSLHDHLRDIPGEDIFELGASIAGAEFCEWVQVGIDVYIPHRKYQFKPYSSPCFSAACAAAIDHKSHFFRFYQQNKFLASKMKFRLVIVAKGFLKLPSLLMLIKQVSINSQKLGSLDFWQLANSVLNKGKAAIPLQSMDLRCCLLLLIKQNCLQKIFLRALILMTQISFYLLFFLELI